MTTTNRHEPAAQRGLAPRSGPVADVNGTNVPRHSDPMHDHWDEAWRLGYAAAVRDAVEAVRRTCGHTKYEGCPPCPHDDAVAAIEALGGER